MKKPFLNTIMGSWVKMFISFALGQITIILLDKDQTLFSYESLKSIMIAGLVPVLPIIINYLNPNDPRYGKNKQTEITEK